MGAEQSRGGPAVANAVPSGVTTLGPNLQKRFSKGVQYNMKVIIKGDRNVGKSCLFQRLQGHKFSEDYLPTPEIQVACIQWNYKVTDDVVKVEIWDIVDKGKQKKREGLKIMDTEETAPALDADFIDVYKGTSGVIMMLDITKYWTYEYVQRELPRVPLDIPVIVMASHRDMEENRSVLSEDVPAFIKELDRPSHAAAVYYMEASMKDGFGLKYLYRFFNIPFLELQRQTLLAQLKRNEEDLEAIKVELDVHGQSEEQDYYKFKEVLELKRKGVLGGLTTVPAGCNETADSSASSEGTEASTLEEGAAMSLRSRLSQKVLLKAPLPATKRLEPNSAKLENFVPEGNLDNSFLGSSHASREPSPKPTRERTKIGDIQLSDSDDEDTVNPQVTLDQESPDEADIVVDEADIVVEGNVDEADVVVVSSEAESEPVITTYTEEPNVSYEEISSSMVQPSLKPSLQPSLQSSLQPFLQPSLPDSPPDTPNQPATPSAVILNPAPFHSIDPFVSSTAITTPLACDLNVLTNELDILDQISCAPPIDIPPSRVPESPSNNVRSVVHDNCVSENPVVQKIKSSPVPKKKKKLKAPPKKSLLDINLTSSDDDYFNEAESEQTQLDNKDIVMATFDEPEVPQPHRNNSFGSLKLVHVDSTPPQTPTMPSEVFIEEQPVIKQKKTKKEKERTEQDELDEFFGDVSPKEPAVKEPKAKKRGKKKKKKASSNDTGYEEF